MRHELFVLTVKNFLQSVYIYGSYRKIKTGVPFFLDHPVYTCMSLYGQVFIDASLICQFFSLNVVFYVHALKNFSHTWITSISVADNVYLVLMSICLINWEYFSLTDLNKLCCWQDCVRGVSALQTLGFYPLSLLPLLSFLPFNPGRGLWGSAVNSPSGSGQNSATECIFGEFWGKKNRRLKVKGKGTV